MVPFSSDMVSRFDIFCGFSTNQITRLIAAGEALSFPSNSVIFEESSVCSDIFLLVEGRVGVELQSPGGSQGDREHLLLATLRQGDVFGEIAFLEGKRRSARICSLDDVQVIRMDGGKLYRLFSEEPSLGYQFMRNLATILAQRVVDVNFKWRQDRSNTMSTGEQAKDMRSV